LEMPIVASVLPGAARAESPRALVIN